MSREEIESLAREVTHCRDCFTTNGDLVAPTVDVAQPRWIGPGYWSSVPRVVLLLLNPGGGESYDPGPDLAFRDMLHDFRDGKVALDKVFQYQREDFQRWGRPAGRFVRFYFDGLGLVPDKVAFANVAWCATSGNRYPKRMLTHCFSKHTERLLAILRPNLVLASGIAAHGFKDRIEAVLPGSTVLPIPHYAHRFGADVEHSELAKIREILARDYSDGVAG